MKHQLLTATLCSLLLSAFTIRSQVIADIENLTLPADTFFNGSTPGGTLSTSGTFTSGNAAFPYKYNSSFGGYWESGWAYSNKKDSTTNGFKNLYSARPASGSNASSRYVIGQQNSVLRLNSSARDKDLGIVFITNGTYPYISMRSGDNIGKKFGGATGNDPDWFKLTIKKYRNGVLSNDSVEFYLADFRNPDNTKDYIIKNWQLVNLNSLGKADSLIFKLSSSDVGQFGMNTPGFFCLDNLVTDVDLTTGTSEITEGPAPANVYPTPTSNVVNITAHDFISAEIFSASGKSLRMSDSDQLDMSDLPAGIYYINILTKHASVQRKLIKQ